MKTCTQCMRYETNSADGICWRCYEYNQSLLDDEFDEYDDDDSDYEDDWFFSAPFYDYGSIDED